MELCLKNNLNTRGSKSFFLVRKIIFPPKQRHELFTIKVVFVSSSKGLTLPSKMQWPNKHVKQMSNSRACITKKHACTHLKTKEPRNASAMCGIGFNSKLLHVLPKVLRVPLPQFSVGTFSPSFLQENSIHPPPSTLANRLDDESSRRDHRTIERHPSNLSYLTTYQ